MRAAWCEQLDPDDKHAAPVTVRDDVPVPTPGPGQVLVRVHAAALNFPDVLMVQGRYQTRVDAPFVPGTEFAGEVVESPVGWATVGTRVAGVVGYGGFAEYAVAELRELRPLHDGLDWAHGAAFPVTYATAYHALVTIGDARPGQTVLVTGAAGGVGLATVDVACRLGLRVVAAASSPDRLALCRERGAHLGVDYTREPFKQRLKDLVPDGLDLVVDPVGGDIAEPALRAVGWGGRFVTVGYAGGAIPRIPLNLVLLKGVIVRGFEMRGIATHHPAAITACETALSVLVADGMRPHIGAHFPLAEVRSGFEHVRGRRALGKVVVEIG